MKLNRFTLPAILSVALLALSMTAGCRGQQITPVPVVTAPPVTSSAFQQLNTSSPATVNTYTDQPAAGSFCYFVQELDGQGVSAASNTTCATTTTALRHVQLNWTPAAGYTCQNAPCSFVVSRAPAVTTPVGVPSMQAPVNAAEVEEPILPPLINLRVIASR